MQVYHGPLDLRQHYKDLQGGGRVPWVCIDMQSKAMLLLPLLDGSIVKDEVILQVEFGPKETLGDFCMPRHLGLCISTYLSHFQPLPSLRKVQVCNIGVPDQPSRSRTNLGLMSQIRSRVCCNCRFLSWAIIQGQAPKQVLI